MCHLHVVSLCPRCCLDLHLTHQLLNILAAEANYFLTFSNTVKDNKGSGFKDERSSAVVSCKRVLCATIAMAKIR